jgi:hypothetical protein
MERDYFAQESPALAERLERHFASARTLLSKSPAAEKEVEALILGGGYGRDEGGVAKDENGNDILFNDLDYFLFCADPANPELLEAVHAIEKEGTADLGIDVEIQCLTLAQVGDPSVSMMFYDMVAGHHVVIGPDDFLTSHFPQVHGANIHAVEASRLLWNRGTGLFFSACRIEREAEMDFVVRNHAKFCLAAGDALLCLDGLYSGKVRERLARFREHRPDVHMGLDLLEMYERAVEFKFRPTLTDGKNWAQLAEENRKLSDLWTKVFLHAESRRLGKTFAQPADYVAGNEPRSPEIPRWKAPLYAVRDILKYRRCLAPVWDYPRNALFRSLLCLLSDDSARKSLPSPEKFLGKSPEPVSKGKVTGWEKVYEFWWQRYA